MCVCVCVCVSSLTASSFSSFVLWPRAKETRFGNVPGPIFGGGGEGRKRRRDREREREEEGRKLSGPQAKKTPTLQVVGPDLPKSWRYYWIPMMTPFVSAPHLARGGLTRLFFLARVARLALARTPRFLFSLSLSLSLSLTPFSCQEPCTGKRRGREGGVEIVVVFSFLAVSVPNDRNELEGAEEEGGGRRAPPSSQHGRSHIPPTIKMQFRNSRMPSTPLPFPLAGKREREREKSQRPKPT